MSDEFGIASTSVTTAAILVQLQSPASLAALTSDPPEDLTILRMRGTFEVALQGAATNNWTLALLVQDVTWTPGATFLVDSDKRILWSRSFQATNATSDVWQPPGQMTSVGGTAFPTHPEVVTVDIAPKVRVQAGQALHLVAYENVATAGTIVVDSREMRLLYKRSGRR